ncbi:MAG: rane-like protein, partial [Rhizorhabdus sp.]|nr:rane-like protein [Rhizorhabdus sp.]
MIKPASSKAPWIALVLLIVAAGIVIRAWRIAADPMWLDEAYSAYAAAKGWTFLWTIVPRYETHPPFYYSLVRAWTLLAGDSLLAHRSLGLVCGIAAIPVMAAAARIAGGMIGLTKARANLAGLATL